MKGPATKGPAIKIEHRFGPIGWRASLPLAVAALALWSAHCSRELSPSSGEGSVDLRWSWMAGAEAPAEADSARLWVLDGAGRTLAGPVVAAVDSASGGVEIALRVPAGKDRAVRLQFEGMGDRGRGVIAAGTVGGIEIPAGGQAEAMVAVRAVVPDVEPIEASPGASSFTVRWSRVPDAVGYELFEKGPDGETIHASGDTFRVVRLVDPARKELPVTTYRARGLLRWGGRTVTGDSSSIAIPLYNDLPRVDGIIPAPDAVGVADSSLVIITFDRPIDAATLGAIDVPVEGNTVTLRRIGGELVGLAPLGSSYWNPSGETLWARPVTALQRDARYRVVVTSGLTDLEGRPLDQDPAVEGLQPYESTFETESYDPMRVTAVVPADGTTGVELRPWIEATLSRPARAATVSGTTVLLADSTGATLDCEVLLAGGVTIRVRPVSALGFGQRYRFTVTSGVRDLRGATGEPLDQDRTTPDVHEPFHAEFRTREQPTGPWVEAVVPSDGERNQPLDGTVRIRFSRPVIASSVDGEFTVRKLPVDAAIGGVLTASADRREFTFNPSLLERGQRYRILVRRGGFDLQGNPTGIRDDDGVPFDQDSTVAGFQDFSTFFRVEDSPRVLSVAPLDHRVRVPVDTTITLRFSRGIALSSVAAGGIALLLDGTPVALQAPEFNADTTEIRFRPAAPLRHFRDYTVRADTSLRSTRGSRFDQLPDLPGFQPFESEFRTDTDGIAPRVIDWLPGEGANEVPVDAAVTVYFSRAVRPPTVLLPGNFVLKRLPSGASVPGTIAVALDSLSAIFQPLNELDFATDYEVLVTHFVEDEFGQGLDQDPSTPGIRENFTGRFSTDRERIPPRVASIAPRAGAVEVPIDTVIVVEFNEPMGVAGTLEGAFTLTGPDGPLAGALALAPDGIHLTFTPSQPLRPAVRFDVLVDTTATDLAGNRLDQDPRTGLLDPFVSFFTSAPDRIPPRVVSSAPAPGDTAVEVTVRPIVIFDEPLDPTSLADGVRLLDSLLVPVGLLSIDLGPDGRAVELVPADTLLFSADYTLEVDAIRDTSGNVIDQDPVDPGAQPYRAFFRTRTETIPPRVLGVRFAAGPPVPVEAPIRIGFSEPIDPASLSSGTVSLRRDGAPVAAALTPVAPDSVELTPADTLAFDTSYELRVDGVRDLLGNLLDQDPAQPGNQPFTLAFRTVPDTVPPRIIGVVPADGAIGIDPRVEIEVTFSERVDPSTVVDPLFALYHPEDGMAQVPGQIIAQPDSIHFHFRPAAPLPDSVLHLVRVEGSIRDLAGNSFDQDPSTLDADSFTSSFRVGVAPVATAGPGLCDPDTTFVAFDASASRDPDGSLDLLVWDWGDGTRDTLALPDPLWTSMSHAYACGDIKGCDGLDNDLDGTADETGAAGCDESYRVILSVRDDHGIWASDTTGVSFCAFLARDVSPPDGAGGVDPALAAVRIRLSRPPDPAQLDSLLVRLESAAESVAVAAAYAWDPDSSQIVLTPADTLEAGAAYRVRLLPGLVSGDAGARPFDQDPCAPAWQGFSSGFSTAAPARLRSRMEPPELLPAPSGPSGQPARPPQEGDSRRR